MKTTRDRLRSGSQERWAASPSTPKLFSEKAVGCCSPESRCFSALGWPRFGLGARQCGRGIPQHPMAGHLIKLICLDQGDPSGVAFASHDSCVSARGELAKDGSFARIGRRNSSPLNGSGLAVLPIVVSRYHVALPIMQLKRWVLE